MAEDNLRIFNEVRNVPTTAQKKITGGNLNGMTDINPMWRIETLTKLFGPAGIGWYTETVAKWLEPGANGEVVAFVDINLYIKEGEEWSKPIQGNGGSKFIANFAKGATTSDEAYKMAYTDALSVACKALGIGADIYWAAGATKYTQTQPQTQTKKEAQPKTEKPAAQPAPKTEQPSVPSVGGDELPDPSKKPKKDTSAVDVNSLRALVVPADIQNFGGKTLGDIADANLEELRNVAALISDQSFRNNIVRLYNAIVSEKKKSA